MWDGGEKMQSQMKFVNHFTPKGGRRGATHFHHIFSTAVTSNLLLTCRIFTWHQSSTPYIIFLHEQINQLIHSCTQKLRHDRTMKIINTFSKETNMKSVTHVHGCCVATKFTVTTDWEYILIVVISLPPKTHKSFQNQHLILYFHGNKLLFYCPWNWQPAQ